MTVIGPVRPCHETHLPVAERLDIEQVAEKYLERRRRGEKPSVDEYARRYPELADEIRDLFPTLAMLEDCASAGGRPAETVPSEDWLLLSEPIGEYRDYPRDRPRRDGSGLRGGASNVAASRGAQAAAARRGGSSVQPGEIPSRGAGGGPDAPQQHRVRVRGGRSSRTALLCHAVHSRPELGRRDRRTSPASPVGTNSPGGGCDGTRSSRQRSARRTGPHGGGRVADRRVPATARGKGKGKGRRRGAAGGQFFRIHEGRKFQRRLLPTSRPRRPASRGGARLRSPPRHPASRHQAVESDLGHVGHGLGHGLWSGQARGRRFHAHGRCGGNAALHGSRTVARPGRRAERLVQLGA
jgi:hypothetical protein